MKKIYKLLLIPLFAFISCTAQDSIRGFHYIKEVEAIYDEDSLIFSYSLATVKDITGISIWEFSSKLAVDTLDQRKLPYLYKYAINNLENLSFSKKIPSRVPKSPTPTFIAIAIFKSYDLYEIKVAAIQKRL
jgi:hypothetical protein